MPEIKTPRQMPKKTVLFALGGIAAAAALAGYLRLDANLRSSTRINQNLRAELETLRSENDSFRDQQKSELSKVETLSRQLNTMKQDKSMSSGRSLELKKLVTSAEKALDAQNRKIHELEAKLRNAEERMARQQKASENLEQQ